MMQQDTSSLKNRMIRAAKLDVALYEEVEADTTATKQAFQAVLVASVATGVGAAIYNASVYSLFFGVLSAVVGWFAWALMSYWVGTRFFKTPETSATVGELLRTIGFSNSPMVLGIFMFIPGVGGLIFLVASMWALVAGVIAVRQALDFSTGRAIGTCIVGWILYQLIWSLFALLGM